MHDELTCMQLYTYRAGHYCYNSAEARFGLFIHNAYIYTSMYGTTVADIMLLFLSLPYYVGGVAGLMALIGCCWGMV